MGTHRTAAQGCTEPFEIARTVAPVAQQQSIRWWAALLAATTGGALRRSARRDTGEAFWTGATLDMRAVEAGLKVP
jgi:hypothetical protein